MKSGLACTDGLRDSATRMGVLLSLVVCFSAGCSLQKTAVDLVGDTLSSGSGAFAREEDPQLMREALPFGLKIYEGLLEVSPEHEGLLLASAQGFAGYAYMLQQEADRIDEANLERARRLRARAKRLYLRGRDYALRGIELNHERFLPRLYEERTVALAETEREDAPFMYWAGAAWVGALSVAKGDATLLGDLPLAASLMARVLELDPTYGKGSAHDFFVSYEAARPGGSAAKARWHYQQALELSEGKRLSVHLALAEGVSLREQNLGEFRTLVEKVLNFELDLAPENRLINTLTKERAQWLQTRIPDLFLDADVEGGKR